MIIFVRIRKIRRFSLIRFVDSDNDQLFQNSMELRSKLYFETTSMRIFLDITTYWSQLILMTAIAFERYMLIARGVESRSTWTVRRRVFLYVLVGSTCALIPTLIFLDFWINKSWSSEELSWKVRTAFNFCFFATNLMENQLHVLNSKVLDF